MKYTIDLEKFWHDPYPDLAIIQAMAPVVYVQQLDAALITRRSDILPKKNGLIYSHPTNLMV